MSFVPFPKIGQFREAVRHVNDKTRYSGKDENGESIFDASKPLPNLRLRGTVKVHGTNAAIRRENGKFICQSRTRDLPYPQDNAGFRTWADQVMSAENNDIFKLFADVERISLQQNVTTDNAIVTVFGEWAGFGVKTNVSVSEVARFFYVFAVKVNDTWLDIADLISIPQSRIWNAESILKLEVDVNFNDKLDVGKATHFFIEKTLEVEKECPVGKFLKTDPSKDYRIVIGEGIVWKATDPAWFDLVFKVKGEEHSHSKVKTLASIDVEKIENAVKFTEYAVTENRLLRGIDALNEAGKVPSRKTTGDFIAWICRDVITEEADTIKENGLDGKTVGNHIGTKAREWFFAYLDKV